MDTMNRIVVLLAACWMAAGPIAQTAAASDGGRAGPDLAVVPGSYAGFPASPRVSDEVTSNFTIKNIGDADPGNYEVLFFMNDTNTSIKPVESDVKFGGLDPGEEQVVSMSWKTDNLTAGVPYTVIMVIDPDMFIADANRSNNRYDQVVTLLPRPIPDFYFLPEEVRLDPPAPYAGDNITIISAIHNGGEGTISFVDIFFYLNDTDHPLSSYYIVYDLNASGAQNISTVWRTGDLPAGNYTVMFYANPPWAQDHIPETNLSNNVLNVSVVLQNRVADLAIRNLSYRPLAPNVGDTVAVTADVANSGSGPSPECNLSVYAGYNIDPVASQPVPALPAGGSASVVVEWNTTGTPQGFTRMRAVVDPKQDVDDSNRANNSFAWNMTLTGQVDMALENLNVTPARPRPGDTVSFSVSVRNLGSLRCNSANLTLRIGGTEADRTQLMTLAAGGMMNATLRWTTAGLVPGVYDYELEVTVGPNDSDVLPSNNLLGGQLVLLAPEPRADLRVRDLVSWAQPPRSGDALAFGVVVENAGNLDAGASTVMATLESALGMALRFTDTPVAVPAVPAGKSVTVNLTGDTARFAPGNYTLNITVDYGNDVSESNESNNHLARALSILEPATKRAVLSVGEIFFAGERREGEKVDVIVSIRNTGQATALNVVVTFMIDGKVAATQNLDQIAAGSSRNATLTWTFAPGDHPVKAVVASTGLSEVSGQRTVRIENAPSEAGNTILVAALAMILVLVGIVAAWAVMRPKAPGPKVRLVDEEE